MSNFLNTQKVSVAVTTDIMVKTNVYGVLNPDYPTYDDKEEELEELMRYFEYAYLKTSGYTGTVN